jgi:predicted transcriptional regulator
MDESLKYAMDIAQDQARIRVMLAEEHAAFVSTLAQSFRAMDAGDGSDPAAVAAAMNAAAVIAGTVPQGCLGFPVAPSQGGYAVPAAATAQSALPAAAKPPCNPRNSIRKDVVICLECGHRTTMLTKAHLAKHGMTPEEYKAKWGIKPDVSLLSKDALAKHQESVSNMREKAKAKRGPSAKGKAETKTVQVGGTKRLGLFGTIDS